MAYNLLAPLGDRYSPGELAAARDRAAALGFRMLRAPDGDERLAAWIDWQFAPGWWSSEVRASSVWYALAPDGTIAGFAAFGLRERKYHWLRAYAARDDVAIFGPYGVTELHRGSGIGATLLTAALCELASRAGEALIPAVGNDRLAAMYVRRTGARIVDTYDYALPPLRTVILASGNGTNAQAVIDARMAGRIGVDLGAIITDRAGAFVRERARAAGIVEQAVVWARGDETRAAYDTRIIDAVARYDPQLVLLLGWMHLLPEAFIERFPRTINVHPSFLPFDPTRDDVVMPDGTSIPVFRGARAPEATLAAAAPWAGVSVHDVTAATDRGAILVRTPVQLPPGTTRDGFAAATQPLEHAAVVAAIRRVGFEAPQRTY